MQRLKLINQVDVATLVIYAQMLQKTEEMISLKPNRASIEGKFRLFQGGTGGLDSWLGPDTPDEIYDVLANIENQPLSKALFNQLLTLAHEAPISEALFDYYWLRAPDSHPYDVKSLPCYDKRWTERDFICSLDQLYWGLYRFYVDALLYFGNIRTGFQRLRQKSGQELADFFHQHRVDARSLQWRGDAILPRVIAKDSRYLISEMACKSYEPVDDPEGELAAVLLDLFRKHKSNGGGPTTTDELLTGAYKKGDYTERQSEFKLSADAFRYEVINDERELLDKINAVADKFREARSIALENTKIYLSMVGDLDVYVATSMREPKDFTNMAEFCETVFGDPGLEEFRLRYFDPTLSAAANHEDKGLIECLMVKCAKILVLHAGTSDSYGKDAEAAMALSLGKPVIIHADQEYRSRFFRDVHPLSRLINFVNGVATGAMVATSPDHVAELLKRILTNNVHYELSQPSPGYLVLTESITKSVVRLQTSDTLLRETFWNHYHNDVR